MSATHHTIPSIFTPPVTQSGLYDMTAEEYHADPCPVPSLNHTIAKLLHERSPLHAFNAHPRLGAQARKTTRAMDIGSAVHALALCKGAKIAEVKFDNFLSKAAKEERDAHLSNGVTPLLTKDYELAQRMAPLMRAGVERAAGHRLEDLLREVVAIAQDGESWCRSMFDAITPDLRTVIDAKTAVSSEPDTFGRYAASMYATQVAFYFQVLDLIDPEGKGKRRFVFVAQERDTPEAITFHELDPTLLSIADAHMQRARLRWITCSHMNVWPSYVEGPHIIAPRPWDFGDEVSDSIEAAE